MYKDPGILCATPTDIFFNGFRPNQKPFCGCWGCLASLRSCKHLPAHLQPPRGWADGGRPRALRPDHFEVPLCGQAACTNDAPMWCDRRSRTGQEGRYTIGARSPDSSAPGIPDAEAAVGELVKKTYIIHGSWPEIKLER